MEITAKLVNELRQKTGVSMMQCKKALVEAEGDMEKAVEILRKKGAAKAEAKADRETKEGAVVIYQDGGKATMVSLQCETDFVARNEGFSELGMNIAKLYSEKGEGASEDIDALLKEGIVKLGENITLGEAVTVEGATLGSYIHLNNRIGAVVALEGGTEEQARDAAMHAAAMNPAVVSPDEVDASLIEKEKEIYAEQLKNEGKPENIIGNIIEGKIKKFKEEKALLTQAFIKDPSQTVGAMLGDAKIAGYKRLEV